MSFAVLEDESATVSADLAVFAVFSESDFFFSCSSITSATVSGCSSLEIRFIERGSAAFDSIKILLNRWRPLYILEIDFPFNLIHFILNGGPTSFVARFAAPTPVQPAQYSGRFWDRWKPAPQWRWRSFQAGRFRTLISVFELGLSGAWTWQDNVFIFKQASTMSNDCLAVLDFGSQYAHLIAKRLRRQGFYEITLLPVLRQNLPMPGDWFSPEDRPVYEEQTPDFNSNLMELELPILGLCYGHQLTALHFGGWIENTGSGEFGKAHLQQTHPSALWKGIDFPAGVDEPPGQRHCLPQDFEIIAKTDGCPSSALQHRQKPIYTLDFTQRSRTPSAVQKSLQIFRRFVGCPRIGACRISSAWPKNRFGRVASRKVWCFSAAGSILRWPSPCNEALNGSGVDSTWITVMRQGIEQIMQRYRDWVIRTSKPGISAKNSWGPAGLWIPTRASGGRGIHPDAQVSPRTSTEPGRGCLDRGRFIRTSSNPGKRTRECHQITTTGWMRWWNCSKPVNWSNRWKIFTRTRYGNSKSAGLPESIVWRHPFGSWTVRECSLFGKQEWPGNLQQAGTTGPRGPSGGCSASVLPVRSVGVQEISGLIPRLLFFGKPPKTGIGSRNSQSASPTPSVKSTVSCSSSALQH